MINLLGAHDFPFIFIDQAKTLFSLPYSWSLQSHDSLGVFTLPTLWTWVYGLLFGLGANLGLHFSISTFIFGIIPAFIISWYGMGKLLSVYQPSLIAKRSGQLIYAANTYLLMLLDGGQLSLAVGYAFFPLVLANVRHRLKFIVFISLVSFLDIRYLYILLIPISLKVLFDIKNISYYLKTGIVTVVVVLGLHSYWLLPSILTKGPSLPATYTRSDQISSLSFATITHTLSLLHPHWPENIFGKIPLPSAQFFLLAILAFFPLAIYRKSKPVAFWSCLAIIAVFLAKGNNPPLPNVYTWLFIHVPGFNLFRDPTKFYTLIAMAYAVLVVYTANFISRRFPKGVLLIPLYIIMLLLPVLTGQATGLLSIARNQSHYLSLANFLQQDPNPGNLVWVPSKPPLGYSSPTHPSIDALRLLDKRAFATGVVGSYELLNFLRDATYSGQLLEISTVKYVAFPAVDSKRDSLKIEDLKYKEVFTNQISKLPWVANRYNFGDITLLETKEQLPLFFIPDQTIFVVGSDDVYRSNLDLSQTALIFAEEHPEILSQISKFPNANLLLNKKTKLDAALALVDRDKFIFPGSILSFSPDRTGWWKRETSDLISWRNFLQEKYQIDNQDFDFGGGWAISEGKNNLEIPIKPCISSCILLARVMTSSQGGDVSFSSLGSIVGQINTKDESSQPVTTRVMGYADVPDKHFTYSNANFSWYEVGQLPSTSQINISTNGNINVVNALVVMPMAELADLKDRAAQLDIKPIVPTTQTTKNVTYKRINPAHFQVQITGLSNPSTLIFSQNYDPLWLVSGQSSTKAYSFINAFPLEKDGVYDIYFQPQKYVSIGLVLSLFTLIVLSVVCLYIFLRAVNKKTVTI